MKLELSLLERPSHVKRQGLYYHLCVPMDVCSNMSQNWCSIWLDKKHIWWDIVLYPTVFLPFLQFEASSFAVDDMIDKHHPSSSFLVQLNSNVSLPFR